MTTTNLDQFLASHTLCHGLGELDADGNGECCSIAAINWCQYGECDDKIRETESAVIGQWVIGVQDAMPLEMVNSERWKRLLARLPGLGQRTGDERVRLDVMLSHMWSVVLPDLQALADERGFDDAWRHMTTEQTAAAAAHAAAHAARAAGAAARAATWAAHAAAHAAAGAADAAARAAARAAGAADAAAHAAADAAARAATCAAHAADAANRPDFWTRMDPCGLLESLVEAREAIAA